MAIVEAAVLEAFATIVAAVIYSQVFVEATDLEATVVAAMEKLVVSGVRYGGDGGEHL